MKLNLIKCHGSGNDFFILDEYNAPLSWSDEERANLTKLICDRKTGLGADGILFFQNSEVADGKMRVFNSDGTEASMCGNGLRCIARYACELLGKKQLRIETMKAVLAVEETAPIYGDIPTYQVEISPISFNVADLPMNAEGDTFMQQTFPELAGDLKFTAVAVPNPHIITIVNNDVLQGDVQKTFSEHVNGENRYFPDGVNVSFVAILEQGNIFVRTFERGVGFTNACGTAMSASTLVTCLLNKNSFEEAVTVYNPGGKVKCIAHQKGEEYSIDLIGNATYEYEVLIDVSNSEFVASEKTMFDAEAESYRQMQKDAKAYLKSKLV
ncbi:diaminopimelate epimerase [Bacillus sp. AGMB 02131]|uniref:Diaminopimelate epimerase n=1 Tax=Peribacillus faecalis TaxID=2772559 RepID=A0A927D1J7_9BACI|nr:diaminopimelate epimerase [Peribacillus faecalis]MBD3109800.1 diaminopimelate epimerase [Peribacillus faecalis]